MYPTAMTISHRASSTGSWTFVQSGSLFSTNGWSEMQLTNPPIGGEFKIDLTVGGQHTIISEFSIQGACVP